MMKLILQWCSSSKSLHPFKLLYHSLLAFPYYALSSSCTNYGVLSLLIKISRLRVRYESMIEIHPSFPLKSFHFSDWLHVNFIRTKKDSILFFRSFEIHLVSAPKMVYILVCEGKNYYVDFVLLGTFWLLMLDIYSLLDTHTDSASSIYSTSIVT